MLMLLIAKLGIFLSNKSYSGASLIQFHFKGNNGSKSGFKGVFQCRFQPIIPRNMYKKKTYCLLPSTLSEKWRNLTWPRNSPNFNLHHILKGLKMVVLTPKFIMVIIPHTKFLLMKYFKSSHS